MEGHIKIHRRMLEWEWYSNLNTCRVFLHMLLKANWKDGRFQGQLIERGSFVTSLTKLSDETSLTVNEVRGALKNLKSTGEITSTAHSKYSVFTVVNYNLYQDINKQNHNQITNSSQADHNQITNTSQPINKLLTTIEEKKEEKEGKKARREEKSIKGVYVPDEKLNEAILDFIKHRKAIKKPMTDRAIELLIKRLDNMASDHDEQIELLEHAILKGWQTPYPIKDNERRTDNEPRSNTGTNASGLIQEALAAGVSTDFEGF